MTRDLIRAEDRAEIAEQAVALFSMLHPRPAFLADPLYDRLERVCAWGVAYAREADTTWRHFILDAADDFPAFLLSSETPVEAVRIIHRATQVVVAVRAAVGREVAA